MNTHFLITLAAVLLSFTVPALFFTRFAGGQMVFNRSASIFRSAFLPIAITVLPLMLLAYALFYDPKDFIYSLNVWEIVLPIAFGIVIFATDYVPRAKSAAGWIILAGSAVCALTLPQDAVAAMLPFNPWLTRGIIAVAWFLFSYGYRYVNSGDAMIAVQSTTISSGIGILAALGALPFLIGLFGWIYTGAFAILLSFTWYPARIGISKDSASAFGFILFGTAVLAMGENCLPCILIFSMFMIVDTLWAIAYRFTFLEQYRDILANTAFQQALHEGLTPRRAASFSIRIQFVLVIFGCLQVYSPNQMSLVVLSAILAIWLSYKFRILSAPPQSLKDINRQVLEDLQDRVNDFKEYIKKDDDF